MNLHEMFGKREGWEACVEELDAFQVKCKLGTGRWAAGAGPGRGRFASDGAMARYVLTERHAEA